MKRIVLLLLAATVAIAASACNGSHHSPTDPGTAPVITNLKVFGFDRADAKTGSLPLSFDFADPEGDIARSIVTFSNGAANNPLGSVAGQKSGTASLLQSVILPDPAAKELDFTVQLVDAKGNLSNTVSGKVTL
ncbi:MAG TPA: hypothetical protein VGS07_31890 [Thermoanaerobaculia bacterium]|jgi:hypothetical protein|nr:hypothetical protein [Thermoanaerobaculia bacterium]